MLVWVDIEKMQRYHSTIGLDEKRAAVAGVLRLVPPEMGSITVEAASTPGSDTACATLDTRSRACRRAQPCRQAEGACPVHHPGHHWFVKFHERAGLAVPLRRRHHSQVPFTPAHVLAVVPLRSRRAGLLLSPLAVGRQSKSFP